MKAWKFPENANLDAQIQKVTFHFRLEPPDEGYDEEPTTKVELDGAGGIRVISLFTIGLQRSGCPNSEQRIMPPPVTGGDFVELQRWNETVRVGSDGSIIWGQGKSSHKGRIHPDEAKSLLERFRTPAVWGLCGFYDQAGLMDGDASSFTVRVGGREKRVGEYGDSAPPIFGEVELAVDATANTHQWRHGDPETESIVEINFEYLPKPGKTKLMDAANRGDKAGVQAALSAGDKLTDIDASGWTPLMYAASSHGDSVVRAMLEAGANVNARSKRGETALMASAVAGTADKDLLNAGADVNAVNDLGMNALMLLAQRGSPDEISALIKAGADAARKDAAGRTALDYLNAANCGHPIVQEKDPQWMKMGYSSCNALDNEDFQKSKQLLIEAGARVTRIPTPDEL